MAHEKRTLWIARGLVGVVTFLNLQAAFLFILRPQDFYGGFELSGEQGMAMIRGMGLLFLMWNIPYLVALIHPVRHYVSLMEAVIMQSIGVAGESLLLAALPGQHPQLQASVMRFIYFDGGGLILLLAAFILVRRLRNRPGNSTAQ